MPNATSDIQKTGLGAKLGFRMKLGRQARENNLACMTS